MEEYDDGAPPCHDDYDEEEDHGEGKKTEQGGPALTAMDEGIEEEGIELSLAPPPIPTSTPTLAATAAAATVPPKSSYKEEAKVGDATAAEGWTHMYQPEDLEGTEEAPPGHPPAHEPLSPLPSSTTGEGLPLDPDGTLPFFFIDAFENNEGRPGEKRGRADTTRQAHQFI